MSSFILKIAAIITMTIDHYCKLFPNIFNNSIVYIGRFSFPIFAFLITEGYIHTHKKSKYLLRLFIFAIISQFPYYLAFNRLIDITDLNVLFNLSFGLVCIIYFDYFKNKYYFSIPIIVFICFLSDVLKIDYGAFGILLILLFYIFKQKKIYMNVSYILLITIYYFKNFFIPYNFNYKCFIYYFFNLLPIIFINLYNGKKGINTKYLFYIYYPMHLLILYFIMCIF